VSNEPLILIVDDEISIRRLLRAALLRSSRRAIMNGTSNIFAC